MVEAPHGNMPLTGNINVALREQFCQKIGSERVYVLLDTIIPTVPTETFL